MDKSQQTQPAAIGRQGGPMLEKAIGEAVSARCSCCGSFHVQIAEELSGNNLYEVRCGKVVAFTAANVLDPTGRTFGKCRQCGHQWRFRKNPLAAPDTSALAI